MQFVLYRYGVDILEKQIIRKGQMAKEGKYRHQQAYEWPTCQALQNNHGTQLGGDYIGLAALATRDAWR